MIAYAYKWLWLLGISTSLCVAQETLGTMSILPHVSSTRISATDVMNSSTGTLTTNVNPGLLLDWGVTSGRYRFLLFLDMEYFEMSLPSSKGVTDRSGGLGSAGFGIGYEIAGETLTTSLFHSYTQAQFIRALSETQLAIDRITIPEVGLQVKSIFTRTDSLALVAVADGRAAFSVSSENIEYRNGWSVGGKIYSSLNLDEDVSLDFGPYASYSRQNSQTVLQSRLQVGLLAGLTWTLQ